METKVMEWNEKTAIVDALRREEVVVFPTETVYGIACLASSKKAFDALREAKGRPENKPFTLMCSSIGQAAQYCQMDLGASSVMGEFMPGEVTLLLRGRPGIPETIDLGTGIVGVRVPNDENVLALIEEVGEPLLVSSANMSGSPAAACFEDAIAAFDGKVAVIVRGTCSSKTPSTILDLANIAPGEAPRVIRQGSVDARLMADMYRNSKKTIAIGSDHGGFDFKEEIRRHLIGGGYTVIDHGCHDKKSVDYPQYGKAVGQSVVSGQADLGVVVCTSGIGISIAANKVPGIRCGLAYDDVVTIKMREHNNANVIAFGQKYMRLEDVLRRLDIFLTMGFSKETKHHRRVDQLED